MSISLSKMAKTQLLALPMQFEANAGQVDAQVESFRADKAILYG